jgi:hypothetical protein
MISINLLLSSYHDRRDYRKDFSHSFLMYQYTIPFQSPSLWTSSIARIVSRGLQVL